LAKKNLKFKLKSIVKLGWFGIRHPIQLSVLWQVRQRHLSYLDWNALMDLSQAVWQVEKSGVEGCFIEAGCALGGSAITIAAARHHQQPFWVYDAFEGMPPPSDRDDADVHERYQKIVSGQAPGIGGGTYYGYLDNLQDQVRNNFIALGIDPGSSLVNFVPGLFEKTLSPEGPVALAHLDCDWYNSVMVCLQRIVPHLSVGGILIIDDYSDWSGCRQAVDDYFAGQKEQFIFTPRSRLHIRRIGSSQ
jgi:asparagine synthase (glutamine-hydrolysing)